MPRPAAALFFLALLLPSTLPAQWRLSLVGSSARTSAHAAIDEATERIEVAPDRPSAYTLGVTRDRGAWRFGLSLRRTQSDLVLRGPETAIVTRGDLAAWGGGVEIGRLVVGGPGLPSLHAAIGANLDRWTFPVTDGDPRTVTTGTGALEASVPLSLRWTGIVRGEAGFGGSLFGPDDLPPGYGVRAGRRWGIGLGVGWRL